MGNYFRRIVLAPDIESSAIRELARLLRRKSDRPGTLVACDLEGRQVRKPEQKLAKELGVCVVDGNMPWPSDLLWGALCELLRPDGFLLREEDDEEIDVWRPRESWLQDVYGTDQLDWLVDLESPPVVWNTTSYYVIPSNPAEWDVDVPLMASLLIASSPGAKRNCPLCGTGYVSQFLRGQCPQCRFVFEAFASRSEAFRIMPTRIDGYNFGRCGRCRASVPFTGTVQQCLRCGQLLEAPSDRNLPDNREIFDRCLNSLGG